MPKHQTANQIISDFESRAQEISPDATRSIQFLAAKAQMELHALHARAIACHCECMGMNAENCVAACSDNSVPYHDEIFMDVLRKWSLINEKGDPII